MIRFMPDSLLEALVRPVAMAVPKAAIYVEVIAPDFRFVFVLALALAWLAWRVRARAAAARTLALLAFCAALFVPWLASTGNGRYFIPALLLAGPLCIGLVHHLPFTRGLRLALAGLMLAAQGFLVYDVQPWHSWGLVQWGDGPAFAIEVPQDLRDHPATYVTVTAISYSLIAPEFHPASRWINLSTQQGRPADAPDMVRARRLLQASPVIYAVFPSLPRERAQPHPTDAVTHAVDIDLIEQHLRLDPARACRALPAPGLTGFDDPEVANGLKQGDPRFFWVCPVTASSQAAPVAPEAPPDVEAVMHRVEKACPRMFPPGDAHTVVEAAGVWRFYPESDMRLYVLQDGEVLYKYLRALNAVSLGRMRDVLASGFKMDCNVHGRAGMPWDREI